jgi:hypothetical protein
LIQLFVQKRTAFKDGFSVFISKKLHNCYFKEADKQVFEK